MAEEESVEDLEYNKADHATVGVFVTGFFNDATKDVVGNPEVNIPQIEEAINSEETPKKLDFPSRWIRPLHIQLIISSVGKII